ncbi:zinc-binding dehydrogenase [Mycobacterium sp. OTB74]|jgi:threonine dehydrogenase-like Zn-dependent dehydrogenase|uniref:zinc-binding dehydrogenase n=1 Tax=Mycobacterium sp. OTB74 TaxID=1853452 RepID=UPI002476031E|nr:zinc-binding dehydrogenase [Mycobacterium sp. OTB74]MDH6245854.1 threonine dehydrogenase-like Zn-dependent dehydrogenase [Mycobacterium sp. OTB74]
MRAVVMQDAKLRVEEIDEPVPGPGEALVDVLACGICGSDLHCLAHAPDLNAATSVALGVELMDLSRPVVFGHEFVGRVAAYGPGTSQDIPVGSRVVAMPALLRGQTTFLGFGGPEIPGAYAERILLSEALMIQVPDHLPTDIAALTEPLAVAYRTVGKADLGDHDVALVVGCGPIGLAVIAVLRLRDDRRIVAADFSPERRALARRLGADIVVDPAVESPYAAWLSAAVTDDSTIMAPPTPAAGQLPLCPTVAFECVGAPGVIDQIITGSPPGSRIVVPGLCMTADTIHPAQAVLKEIDVRFAMMYSAAEFAETFARLAAGDFDVAPLLTGTVGMDEVADAFDRLANSPSDAKILLDPTR